MNRFLGRGYQQYPNLRDRVAGGICFCFENLFCCPAFAAPGGRLYQVFCFRTEFRDYGSERILCSLQGTTKSTALGPWHSRLVSWQCTQKAALDEKIVSGDTEKERERERQMDVCMYVRMSVHYMYMRMICLCIYIYTYTYVDRGRGTEKKGDAGKQTMHDYYIA